MQKEFKVLTYCGMFVDERLLGRGIYTTGKPVLHSKDATIDMIADFIKSSEFSAGALLNYDPDVYIENLRKCRFAECELTLNFATCKP